MPDQLSSEEAERQAAALQYAAEDQAAKEDRTTTAQDYWEIDAMFDVVRSLDAKRMDAIIDQLGQHQELKTTLGKERFSVLSLVAKEVANDFNRTQHVAELRQLARLMDQDQRKELLRKDIEDIISELSDKVRSDPRIQEAFHSQDELLATALTIFAKPVRDTLEEGILQIK